MPQMFKRFVHGLLRLVGRSPLVLALSVALTLTSDAAAATIEFESGRGDGVGVARSTASARATRRLSRAGQSVTLDVPVPEAGWWTFCVGYTNDHPASTAFDVLRAEFAGQSAVVQLPGAAAGGAAWNQPRKVCLGAFAVSAPGRYSARFTLAETDPYGVELDVLFVMKDSCAAVGVRGTARAYEGGTAAREFTRLEVLRPGRRTDSLWIGDNWTRGRGLTLLLLGEGGRMTAAQRFDLWASQGPDHKRAIEFVTRALAQRRHEMLVLLGGDDLGLVTPAHAIRRHPFNQELVDLLEARLGLSVPKLYRSGYAAIVEISPSGDARVLAQQAGTGSQASSVDVHLDLCAAPTPTPTPTAVPATPTPALPTPTPVRTPTPATSQTRAPRAQSPSTAPDLAAKAADHLAHLQAKHLLEDQVVSIERGGAWGDQGDAITHTALLASACAWHYRTTGDPKLLELLNRLLTAIDRAFEKTGTPGVACRGVFDGRCYEPGNVARSFTSRDVMTAVMFAYSQAWPALPPGSVKDAVRRRAAEVGDQLLKNNRRIKGTYQGTKPFTVHVNFDTSMDASDLRYLIEKDVKKTRDLIRTIAEVREDFRNERTITIPVPTMVPMKMLVDVVKKVREKVLDWVEKVVREETTVNEERTTRERITIQEMRIVREKIIEYVPTQVTRWVERHISKKFGRFLRKLVKELVRVTETVMRPVERWVEKKILVPVERWVEKKIIVPVVKWIEKKVKMPVEKWIEKNVIEKVVKWVDKITTIPVKLHYRPDDVSRKFIRHCLEGHGGLDVLAQRYCGVDALIGRKHQAAEAAALARAVWQLVDSVGGQEHRPGGDDGVLAAFFDELLGTLNEPDDTKAAGLVADIVTKHYGGAFTILVNRVLNVVHRVDTLPSLARVLADDLGVGYIPYSILKLAVKNDQKREVLKLLFKEHHRIRNGLGAAKAALPRSVSRPDELRIMASNGIVLAGMLKTAAYITEEPRFAAAYAQVAPEVISVATVWNSLVDRLYTEVQGDQARDAHAGESSHLLPYLAYFQLALLPGDTPTVAAGYRKIIAENYSFIADEHQAFQDIQATVLGIVTDDRAKLDAVTQLFLYPPYSTVKKEPYTCGDPRVNQLLGGCIKVMGKEKPFSRLAQPLHLRHRSPMTWAFTPRRLSAPDGVFPGTDYLVAYYLAEFHQLLTPEVVSSAKRGAEQQLREAGL